MDYYSKFKELFDSAGVSYSEGGLAKGGVMLHKSLIIETYSGDISFDFNMEGKFLEVEVA